MERPSQKSKTTEKSTAMSPLTIVGRQKLYTRLNSPHYMSNTSEVVTLTGVEKFYDYVKALQAKQWNIRFL